MAKVRSERELVDHGIRALVDALGYSGAARFLRHLSKGNGDYLQLQSELFKGRRLEQIYKDASEHYSRKQP
jgi:hypothetical protein